VAQETRTPRQLQVHVALEKERCGEPVAFRDEHPPAGGAGIDRALQGAGVVGTAVAHAAKRSRLYRRTLRRRPELGAALLTSRAHEQLVGRVRPQIVQREHILAPSPDRAAIEQCLVWLRRTIALAVRELEAGAARRDQNWLELQAAIHQRITLLRI
jgi:hypothetical protein